jgi:antitoxin (DNA-binding transcriptional repressor) of toxin-antitoxin stability system
VPFPHDPKLVMRTISIQEAQGNLPDLIHDLKPGDEVVITEGDQPVARLIGEHVARKPRQPGNCKGMVTILEDDDEHLENFKEYMP